MYNKDGIQTSTASRDFYIFCDGYRTGFADKQMPEAARRINKSITKKYMEDLAYSEGYRIGFADTEFRGNRMLLVWQDFHNTLISQL